MSTFGQRHSRVIVGTLAGDGNGMTLRTAALVGSDLPSGRFRRKRLTIA